MVTKEFGEESFFRFGRSFRSLGFCDLGLWLFLFLLFSLFTVGLLCFF